MSDILALARAHYGRLRGQTIEIPEWSGEDGAPAVIARIAGAMLGTTEADGLGN